MGLKPYDRTIKQIFNNIEYDIDFYQREYKWSDKLPYKPVSSILTDIYHPFAKAYNPAMDITPENIQRYEWYYLNSFMTNTEGRKYIVDGQQRLTTLTLINIALYHLAEEFKLQDNLKETLKNSVYGANEYGTTFWVGFRDRQNALNDILLHNGNFTYDYKTISEINIKENYTVINRFLRERLTDIHKLNSFILYYRERVYLIEIEVDASKDVAMVFEVINDRGVPLKAYEILKGKLISQINRPDNGSYIDIWEEKIAKMEDFGENEINNFFVYFFRVRYCDSIDHYRMIDKDNYHKTIFLESFNSRVGLKEKENRVKEFIKREFDFYTDLYTEILINRKSYNEKLEHVYFNGINDIDGQIILIMSAISQDDNVNLRTEKIKLVSKLFDRLFVTLNLTSSYRSNDFNNIVAEINSEIRNKNLSEIRGLFDSKMLKHIENIKERKALDSVWKYEFFKNRNYTEYGAKFLRYFFARIEYFVSKLSNIPPLGSYYQLIQQSKGGMVFHIEHIVANNAQNLELFAFKEEEFNTERNRLGALVLLKGADNQGSGNELYEQKLHTYAVTGTRYAQTLLKDFYSNNPNFKNSIAKEKLEFEPYDTFTADQIEKRHKLLFELVKRIWEL